MQIQTGVVVNFCQGMNKINIQIRTYLKTSYIQVRVSSLLIIIFYFEWFSWQANASNFVSRIYSGKVSGS